MTKPVRKLKISLTPKHHLKLKLGSQTLTVRGVSDLERLGNQCLDAAIVLKDQRAQT